MGRIFFTSDLHFCHDREFVYAPRGFKTIEQMNTAIVMKWNQTINMDDDVYVLGDIMLNDNDCGTRHLRGLKGRIHIILGNHDSDTRVELYRNSWNVVEVTYAMPLKYNGYHFWLCHYPTITSNYDVDKDMKHRMINLCGHTHTPDPFHDWDKGIIYHVELDAHNNTPVLIDDIIEELERKDKERK